MKYLYVCEKCGKTFSSYEEAANCENSHPYFSGVYKSEYDNSILPKIVKIKFEKDDNEKTLYYTATYTLKCENNDSKLFEQCNEINENLVKLKDSEIDKIKEDCKKRGHEFTSKYYYYEKYIEEYKAINPEYEEPEEIANLSKKMDEISVKIH